MRLKKSTQVALGGVTSAICLLLMFMTGLIPFSSYVFPSMAGIVLIAVAEENDGKTAMLVFAVTSILAILVVPDREAVMLFILLLGYYPILKPKMERLPRVFALLLKLVLVNTVVVVFYYLMKYLFLVPDLLEGWGDFGKYTLFVALGLVNFTFFMYDFLLTQMLILYQRWFRPKILHKTY